MNENNEQIKIERFVDLQKEFDKVFLLEDKGVLSLIVDTVIANQMDLDPVWLFLIAPSSGGKCFDKNQKVLCYDGTFKKVKDIKKGDILMGDDSKPRTVLNTHNETDTMYQISQKRGGDYTVNGKHILVLKNNRSRTEYRGLGKGSVVEISVEDYLKKTRNFKNQFRGYKVGVEFPAQAVQLDSYYLGLWLGDGHRHGPIITNPDKEVVDYIYRYAKKLKMRVSVDSYKKCCSYRINGEGKRNTPNLIWLSLQKYGLGKRKFIPREYLINSYEVRMAVLAGLLDTDGHLNCQKNFEISTKDKKLSDNIVFLARSLGFHTSIKKEKKGIKSTGFIGTYWRVYIGGDIHRIPTRIKRKQAHFRVRRDALSYPISVTKKKTGKYYGFQIDGNGRFLLDDFTVVHNSELITALNDIELGGQKLIYPISDLTTNTFASGQKKKGKETSLLHKMPPGAIMTFKDFTSMLSKNREARAEILGQLREIYDKEYTKRTGTGDDITWRGKVGAIAGATEIVYDYQEDFSAMGDRFVMYSMIQPNRRELLDFVMKNREDKTFNKEAMRQHLRACTKSYIEFILKNLKEELTQLSEETKNDIIEVADFCTLVRSGVVIDKRKGLVEFVPAVEMPTRMIDQLLAIASATLARKITEPLSGGPNSPHNKGQLTQSERDVLYKIAFDSIPLKRRMALKKLAQYIGGITTKGLAMSINYQTPVVQGWLSQLNGLGVCTRESKGGNQGDVWILNQKYRAIMIKFEKISVEEGTLDGDHEDDDIEEAWKRKENADMEEQMIEPGFDNF